MNGTHEKIEVRAHGLYLERNGNGGSQLEDWLKAEKEINKGNSGHAGKSRLIKSYDHGGKAPVHAGK